MCERKKELQFSGQNMKDMRHGGVGRRVRLGCFALLCLAAVAGAQCDPPSSLHHRTKAPLDNSAPPVTKLISRSTIPVEASGEYLFGSDPNDVIQISLGENELGGYISRHGEAENDRGRSAHTLLRAHLARWTAARLSTRTRSMASRTLSTARLFAAPPKPPPKLATICCRERWSNWKGANPNHDK